MFQSVFKFIISKLNIITGLALCVCSLTAQAQFTEYYSTLSFRESPYANHRGVHKLTIEQAKKRNHYKFEYDQQNRLTTIGFYLGEQLRSANHTGNYFWYASKEEYRYQDRKQIVSYFDRHNRPIFVHGKIFESHYLLDENDRRIELNYLDRSGKKIESRWGIANYRWQHENDGSIVEQRVDLVGTPVFLRPGFKFNQIRLSYDVNGFTALMQHINEAGQLIATETGFAQDRFTMSRKGELLRYDVLGLDHQSISANTQGIASGIQTFTEFGYEARTSYQDAKQKPSYNNYGWWRSEREYDQFGNMTLNGFLDLAGKRKNNPNTGYAVSRTKWLSDGGRKKWRKYFDEQGKPVNHATRLYQNVVYDYDNRDRVRAVRLYDATGQLVEHGQQGWAVKQYTYQNDEPVGKETRLTLAQVKASKLDKLLEKLGQFSNVPGMSVAVAQHGNILWQGQIGYADVNADKPIIEKTSFRLASVSKAVTSLLVAELIEAGKISLSDKVSELVNIASEATLAQLLAHTGGLTHYNGLEGHLLEVDYATSTQAINAFKNKISSQKPGEGYRYSTFGYTLVAAMLEAATQKDFKTLVAEFATRHNLDSLQANSSRSENSHLTSFYEIKGNQWLPAQARNFSYSFAGAGLTMTAADLAKVVSQFATHQLVSKQVTEEMLTLQHLNSGEIVEDRGYQVAVGWRKQTDILGVTFFHHAGVTDGARTIVLFEPQTGISIAVLSNASWIADMFNTANSFYHAVLNKSFELTQDRISSNVSNNQKVSNIQAKKADCFSSNCFWSPYQSEEFRQWLAKSKRGDKFSVADFYGSKILLTPYGASVVANRRGKFAALIGRKLIDIQLLD